MNPETGVPRASAGRTADAARVLEDLATLCEGPNVIVHLGKDGGLVTVATRERMIFGKSAEGGWAKAAPERRMKALVLWLHQAAEACRKAATSAAQPQATGPKEDEEAA